MCYVQALKTKKRLIFSYAPIQDLKSSIGTFFYIREPMPLPVNSSVRIRMGRKTLHISFHSAARIIGLGFGIYSRRFFTCTIARFRPIAGLWGMSPSGFASPTATTGIASQDHLVGSSSCSSSSSGGGGEFGSWTSCYQPVTLLIIEGS